MKYTYTTLKEDFSNLENLLHAHNPQLYGLMIASVNNSFHDEFSTCLGLSLLNLSFDKRVQFLSNRFFLDAINIELMPNDNKFNSYLSFILKNFKSINSPKDIENFFSVESTKFKNYRNTVPLEFGINFQLPTISQSDLDFLDENGYLIVNNAVPESFCDLVLEVIMGLSEIEKNSDKGGYFYGLGKSQRIYNLLGKNKIFWTALQHPTILQLMDHFFARETLHDLYYLTSYHANILNPGAESQILHVDAAVPEPLPPWTIRANSNILLQDYTTENGATEIVPGSHLLHRKPTQGDLESSVVKPIVAKKGSIIVWHGNLWHRSGENTSDKSRVALLGTFCASHFREMCLEENPYLNYDQDTSNSFPNNLKNLMGWHHGIKNYA